MRRAAATLIATGVIGGGVWLVTDRGVWNDDGTAGMSGMAGMDTGARKGSAAGAALGGGGGVPGTVPGESPRRAGALLPAALPGMPGYDPADLYAFDRPGMVSPTIASALPRVYVPNTESDTVTVIDPADVQSHRTMRVGHEPQHVVPSWDLQTLWVNNDLGNRLTPIDPRTGKVGAPCRCTTRTTCTSRRTASPRW